MASKPRRPGPSDSRGGSRHDDLEAFIPDPEDGRGRVDDDLPESLAEDFLEAVTSGGTPNDETSEAAVPEEIGGPFVPTSPAEEFADDADASNPPDATREPLPRAMAADPTPARD